MPLTSTRRFTTIEQRRTYVMDQYLTGKNQYELAAELGVDQALISYDMTAVRKEWKEARIRDLDALKDIALAHVEQVRQAAWEGWQRSLQPHKSRSRSKTVGGQLVSPTGEVLSKQPTATLARKQECRVGDPRFLERLQKAIDQYCAILGLLAPVEITETVKVSIEERTREANARLAALRQTLQLQRESPGHGATSTYSYPAEEAEVEEGTQ